MVKIDLKEFFQNGLTGLVVTMDITILLFAFIL
jgi:hypothetical protein